MSSSRVSPHRLGQTATRALRYLALKGPIATRQDSDFTRLFPSEHAQLQALLTLLARGFIEYDSDGRNLRHTKRGYLLLATSAYRTWGLL